MPRSAEVRTVLTSSSGMYSSSSRCAVGGPGGQLRRVPEAVEAPLAASAARDGVARAPTRENREPAADQARRRAGPRARTPRRRGAARGPRGHGDRRCAEQQASQSVPSEHGRQRDVGKDVVGRAVDEVAEEGDAVGGRAARARPSPGRCCGDEIGPPRHQRRRAAIAEASRTPPTPKPARPRREVVGQVADAAGQEVAQGVQVQAPVGQLAVGDQRGQREDDLGDDAGADDLRRPQRPSAAAPPRRGARQLERRRARPGEQRVGEGLERPDRSEPDDAELRPPGRAVRDRGQRDSSDRGERSGAIGRPKRIAPCWSRPPSG